MADEQLVLDAITNITKGYNKTELKIRTSHQKQHTRTHARTHRHTATERERGGGGGVSI